MFWFLSPLKAVAFIAIQQAVFSVYLGCSFAPNHKGMPIVDPEQRLSFVRRQVISSRNVAGGWFTNVALGGLNFQIEHHLFPNMPRPNLSKAQGLVRAFCVDNDLGYSRPASPGPTARRSSTSAPVPWRLPSRASSWLQPVDNGLDEFGGGVVTRRDAEHPLE